VSEGGAWGEEVRACVGCEDKRRMRGETREMSVSVSVKRRGETESAHGMR